MASIKFGGGITEMRGSIGGNVFARNRSGAYVRSRTKPVNPNSTRQGVIRTIMAYLTSYWASTLSAAERIAWATYASSVAMKNKLGETTYLTGFNHFVRSNSIVRLLGLAPIDAAPTALSLPEKDSTIVMTASVATQEVSIAFDDSLPWALETGGKLVAFFGKPQQATRNFFAGPYKFAAAVSGVPVTGAESPADMAAVDTLVLGQKIFGQFRILRADGRLSEVFNASCIVAA